MVFCYIQGLGSEVADGGVGLASYVRYRHRSVADDAIYSTEYSNGFKLKEDLKNAFEFRISERCFLSAYATDLVQPN